MPDVTTPSTGRPVYIVDGARTPQLKAKGAPGPFSAADLAVGAGRPLLLRQPFEPAAFDEVVLGCVMPGPDEANIARIVGLRLGLPQRTPAWTVQRNCASGMQAIDSAFHDIAAGQYEIGAAGGDVVKGAVDGLHAGGTVALHGTGGRALRQTEAQADDAGDIGFVGAGHHAAQHHFVEGGRLERLAQQQRPAGADCEVGGAERPRRTLGLELRRAGAVDDVDRAAGGWGGNVRHATASSNNPW